MLSVYIRYIPNTYIIYIYIYIYIYILGKVHTDSKSGNYSECNTEGRTYCVKRLNSNLK